MCRKNCRSQPTPRQTEVGARLRRPPRLPVRVPQRLTPHVEAATNVCTVSRCPVRLRLHAKPPRRASPLGLGDLNAGLYRRQARYATSPPERTRALRDAYPPHGRRRRQNSHHALLPRWACTSHASRAQNRAGADRHEWGDAARAGREAGAGALGGRSRSGAPVPGRPRRPAPSLSPTLRPARPA